MKKLVEHHIKYLEIHGVDETVLMTQSEHQKLHYRLRRGGKCNIPVDELKKIAHAAHNRTAKTKERKKNYNKQNFQQINFHEAPGKNIDFHEQITYNKKTGNVSYFASFKRDNAHKLPVINIE